jgi:hypothetical protein
LVRKRERAKVGEEMSGSGKGKWFFIGPRAGDGDGDELYIEEESMVVIWSHG